VTYVDTSLLLAVYTPEERSEEANQILRSASEIFISDLTVAEFLVGLARKVKLAVLSGAQSEAARDSFEAHLVEGLLRRVPLRSSYSELAGELASRSEVMLRTLDSLHLVVASQLETPLATFDGRLADAARNLGLEVLP
jgi:predicted nucleic acid-binding protein